MAITGDTLTTANLGLKTLFRKKLIRDIPDEVKFFTAIKNKTKNVTVGGRSLTATWAVETSRGHGYNAFSEGGDLATPRAMGFANYDVIDGLDEAELQLWPEAAETTSDDQQETRR